MGALVEEGIFIFIYLSKGEMLLLPLGLLSQRGGKNERGGGREEEVAEGKSKESVDGRKVQGRWNSPRIGSPENNANTAASSTCGGWN